jgi:hypothetical protein
MREATCFISVYNIFWLYMGHPVTNDKTLYDGEPALSKALSQSSFCTISAYLPNPFTLRHFRP